MPEPPEYMFACEFEKVSVEGRAMKIPSGKKPVGDVFISGALTERSLNKMQKRVFMRVADATGVFIVSAQENSPMAEGMLSLKVPSFISVYGTLSSGYYEGSLRPLVIPYTVKEISSGVRDILVTETAKRTVQRIKGSGKPVSGDIIPVLNSAKLILDTVKETGSSKTAPPSGGSADGASAQSSVTDDDSLRDGVIIPIIESGSGKKGILMDELFEKCRSAGIPDEKTKSILVEMLEEGDCYMPPGGYLKLL
ncbi:hypothetical protein [Methanoplanus limicola]|nr:hypothetical protein [Methanoplanus limicola]